MKVKINTTTLKNLVSKAIKGAAQNKLIPLTNLLIIEASGGELRLTTTDATNRLTVKTSAFEGEDFYVAVLIDSFSKLVSKTTSASIELEVTKNSLKVKGNGLYNIDLPIDENGEMIKFPFKTFTLEKAEKEDAILSAKIKTVPDVNNGARSEDYGVYMLRGYYFDRGRVVTTDQVRMTVNHRDVFSEPLLMSPEMLDLLCLFPEELISYKMAGEKLQFETDSMEVYGTVLEDPEDYPIVRIDEIMGEAVHSRCEISKQGFLDALDRIVIFTDEYSDKTVKLTFQKEGILVANPQGTSSELVHFADSEDFNPFTCSIHATLLIEQLKAHELEVIKLEYGLKEFIRLSSDAIMQIVALGEH